MSRLAATFARTAAEDRVALLPYLTAGFPDPATSRELVRTVVEAGADALEIGIPFSDPMADGLTLQRANQKALESGAGLQTAFELARNVKELSPDCSVVFMSYYNPLLAFGEHNFCRAAVDAGADGLVAPDLPPEEAASLRAACRETGLDFIGMLAPTSTPQRIRLVTSLASGFIYCVALVGVTGARSELSSRLGDFLSAVRAAAQLPLVAGFGISRPEHIRAMRHKADGVIVASALADLIESTPPAERTLALAARIRELRAAGSPAGVAT